MNGNVANIRKKIAGAFDLLMLFGRGIDAFSGTRRAALLSLIIPAALSPVSFFFCALYPPKGMEKGFSLQQIAATVALQTILSTVIATALIIAFAWMLNKLNKFWLFMEAGNWLTLATFIGTLPFVLAAIFGWVPREEMDRVFVIIQCYLYIVTACVFFRAFQVNWQLAGFMAVVMLFVDQAAWNFMFYARG